MRYTKHVTKKGPPASVTQPIPDAGQVKNSDGAFVWKISDWDRLHRFLILGTEGGSYYASEKKLTQDNAKAVLSCMKEDGMKAINEIVKISDEGSAPKNDPALFALALIAKNSKDPAVRKAAYEALPKVARIGTHLFHFAQFIEDLGGWGRATRRAFSNWYLEKPADKLALQVVKYQQRDGWSHRDILRKAHPSAEGTHQDILHYAVKGWEDVGKVPHPNEALQVIWAFERAKKADKKELIKLISEYRLPHECVPNEAKDDPKVWEAMLPSMGLMALVRNLGKMTNIGMLKPLSSNTKEVISKLTDVELIKKARIHPLQLLVALKTYGQGHGERGKLSWSPNQNIVDALDEAFYKSFKFVEPTGKRTLLALDLSSSMCHPEISGMPGISSRVGSAAMALVTANVEPNYYMMGFHHQFVKVNITPKMRLDGVVAKIESMGFGYTDCSLPMVWAQKEKIEVDTFVVYTDNETNSGVHPSQALKEYRRKMGIQSRLVVVGMVSNGFSIADPADPGMLDVVGFDTATPSIISDFSKGLM